MVFEFFILPFFIVDLILFFLNLFFCYLLVFLILGISSLFFYQISTDIFENQLYITNNGIYIIHFANRRHERTYYINLFELQCISFRNRGFNSKKKDSGEIEFISVELEPTPEEIVNYKGEDSDYESRNYKFYVKNNLQQVKKKIESILYH